MRVKDKKEKKKEYEKWERGIKTKVLCLQDNNDVNSAGSRGREAGGLCLQGAEAAFYPFFYCPSSIRPRALP